MALLLTEAEIQQIAVVRQACVDGSAKRARQRARLSQAEVAKYCGCTDAAVSRWEAGERMPRSKPGLRYARWFAGFPADRLKWDAHGETEPAFLSWKAS